MSKKKYRKVSRKRRSVKRKVSRKRKSKYKMSPKSGKRGRRISLRDLMAKKSIKPMKDVEAGRVPISVGRGHNVTISGLINCIGVIITQYSFKTGEPVSVIAGHFETPKMYDSTKHTLTKEGEKFASRIVDLINNKINEKLKQNQILLCHNLLILLDQ